RDDPSFAHAVASIALLCEDRVYVVDATPDFGAQLERLVDVRRAGRGRVDRRPIDGILLTHAHIGHYLGLAQLGFEVMHTEATPVWATPRMAAFLRDNGPWSQLVEQHEIDLRELPPGGAVELCGVTVRPFAVPHRDEYSDTVGYRFEGPRATIAYLPDTEPWDRWPTPIEGVLEGVDTLLVDGTFYSADELPGRAPSTIGHPLVVDTVARFERAVAAGLRVVFIHLNHSNPALEPAFAPRRKLEARGFAVAHEGLELQL
ncbi:MAG TPA: MBL fold metallo-hydrolase, partial [Nannocystaceae bacterium]|nr:MBL fold metallo-hydrolase [Nannocystaceae bacterium]